MRITQKDPFNTGNTFRIGFEQKYPINGKYRLYLIDAKSPMTLHFIPEGLTGGTAALSVDGEPGDNNIVKLAEHRIMPTNFAALFIDIDISGADEGGRLTICVR